MSENSWYDDGSIKKMIASLVEQQVKDSLAIIPEHLAGNKFKVPPAMAEWMDKQWKEQGGGQVDTYYRANIGYGYYPLMIDFVFSQSGVTMSFLSANGERLFMLDLIK